MLDVEDAEWLSVSLVGCCSSGDGEPEDLEADVEECAERRFERRGSLKSFGGAIVVVGVVDEICLSLSPRAYLGSRRLEISHEGRRCLLVQIRANNSLKPRNYFDRFVLSAASAHLSPLIMSGRSKHDELAADDDDDFSTIKGAGADHSFSDGEDDANEEWLAQGDYSSRLEEILSDDEPGDNDGLVFSDDEDDSEGFVYSGKDADMSLASYQEQLRDVLDGDMTSDDEISERAFTTGEHSFASVTHPADVSIEVSSPQVRAQHMPFLAPLTCSSGRSLVRPERFNFVGYPPNLAAFKNVVSGILWIKVNQVSEATFLASWRFKTAFRNAHASTITLGFCLKLHHGSQSRLSVSISDFWSFSSFFQLKSLR